MAPPAGRPRVPLPLRTIAATAVLTLLAIAVGQQDWALPEPRSGDWQVAGVPASLAALLVIAAAVCVAVGAMTTLRDSDLRPRDPAFLAWGALVLVAAAALLWNAVVLAAAASTVVGALIPVFHWAFPFVPALLAGIAARTRRPATALATALGTGVVTVPLLGLGFSLFASRESFLSGFGGSLWTTAVLGVLPLAFGALIAKNLSSNRESSAV